MYSSPYPAHDGSKMRTGAFLDALQDVSELYLLTMERNDPSLSTLQAMRRFRKVWSFEGESSVTGETLSAATEYSNKYGTHCRAWQIQQYDRRFERKILDVLSTTDFDIVFSRYIGISKYLLQNAKRISAKIVVDLDDIEPIKNKREIQRSLSAFSYAYYRALLNNYCFSRYHKNLQSVDMCITCSDEDKAYVQRKNWCRNVLSISNGIEVAAYSDVAVLSTAVHSRKRILFCGNLSYKPNIDGLHWFVKCVWPIILARSDGARLVVVGRTPDPSIQTLCTGTAIELHANVESVIPHYQACAMTIAPIHVGGGTRIKLIESLAARRPAVSTTIGAEGLDLVHRHECLIADTPQRFAKCCVTLLCDYAFARKLANNGYELVSNNYDLPAIQRRIRDAFAQALFPGPVNP